MCRKIRCDVFENTSFVFENILGTKKTQAAVVRQQLRLSLEFAVVGQGCRSVCMASAQP